ncbi:uncharacterized protein LOC132701992 [Cylas formicarius]|uniref:uncharacterized protein LOC132701992 n=1 Tax=Cylas formicarius TaxID=197179 RepID=UPI00295884FD|nr:uncharacterized protein LOC132701992 [Cylas formicarius]XP_060526358.1 uncharacterized protein LOC132701992 [Cylas formicarius]XP_060526359.1 uncharacterized protein LOC132701992 [Cylas formicarius]XP_060526360.1 uncharacterized protein LOC132701992 [Cylas formicarius]
MSPKKPVLPLNYLALKTLSNQLIHALSDEEGKQFEEVGEYMDATTYETLQDLLKEILSCVNLDASIRYSCLEILLREDVKKLDVGIFPRFYYEKILETITFKGKRLQQLNLKGVWVRDYPHLLSNLVDNLRQLKTLIIPHMADDSVLTSVVRLKHITILDISGEASYTRDGVRTLKSDTLKVLDIGNFGKPSLCQGDRVSYELVSEILENLPNLTSLKTYSFTGHALLLLYEKNPHFTTKLTYLHDTGTTLEGIRAIVKLCPLLESAHFDSVNEGVVREFRRLRRLNSLKLTKGGFDEFMEYLRRSGDQLQILKLNHSKNTSLDLSEICVTAPCIVTLDCFQMKLIFTEIDTYFVSLQSIEISYCEVSDECVRYIMTNSPFLRRIVVGCTLNMTDGDVFRLCAECSFNHLEEIWFSYARSLTSTSVELLMGHCPSLRILGQLSGWDVRQEEVDYLRAVIHATNTDLTLLPIGNII